MHHRYVQYQKANNKYYNEYQGASAYYATEDAADAEANGGGRELNRYNFELIDCDVCNTLNCFYSETEATYTEGQTAKPDSEAIASWVETISQCQDTGLYFFTDYPMYAGFMCNEDGSGVDIATFLDESCTIYNSKVAYKSIASADDQLIMYEAKDMIMYPFQHTINCNGEYAYLSMDEYRQQAQSNAYSNNNNNNYGEASDYCQSLFEGGDYGAAVSLKDCNADGEEDERQEGDEEVTEYVDYNFNWFQYSLSYEDSLDNGATCMVVRNMQGEYDRVYRWSGSGQLYNYGTGPSKYSFYNSESLKNLLSSYDKMGATLIAAIVVGVVVALTAFGCILYSCCSKKSVVNGAYMDQKVVEEQQKEQQKELDLKRQLEHQKKLDSKRERLVDASTGHLM